MPSAEPEATVDNLVLKKTLVWDGIGYGTLVVWEYFGFESTDVQQKKVLRKACRGTVATSRGNTTNL